jgi:mRNA interferase RelE/StbE
MARYELTFAARATRDLRGIPKREVHRILRCIRSLQTDPRPPGAKKLSGRDSYRVRQGDCRILYSIFDDVLLVEVIHIGHRKDVYRD